LRAPTCKLPQSFDLELVQTPNLESCKAEEMLVCLSLSIVPLHIHMRLHETDCEKL